MKVGIAPAAALLLDFIAVPESGGNYLAYFGHAHSTAPLPATLAGVLAFQANLVSVEHAKSSATGRYQFMPATLRDLMTQLKLPGTTLFTDDLQDELGLALLRRRGYDAWSAGTLADDAFGDNLTLEWASLPTHAGVSAYGGDGLNRALVTRAALMATIAAAKALLTPVASPAPGAPSAPTPSAPAAAAPPAPASPVPAAPASAQPADTSPSGGLSSVVSGGLKDFVAMELAETLLASVTAFAKYAPNLPSLVAAFPDIITQGEALVGGFTTLVADVKAGKIGNLGADVAPIWAAAQKILSDVGINLGTVSKTVALMPDLPTVAGLQTVHPTT